MGSEPNAKTSAGLSPLRGAAILALVFLALGLPCLHTVPRFFNDDAWEASLGHSLAFEGSLRHGIYEGWGGMHIHFLQPQVVQPFVLAAIYKLAGFSIVTSRLGSVLAGLVAVVCVYGVMRRWYGARTALWIGLATTIYPMFFEVSRRIRPDIYAVALAYAATWCALRTLSGGRRRDAFGFGVLGALAGLAHPTGLVLAGTLLIGAICVEQPVRPLRGLAFAGLGFVLAATPYIVYLVWATRDPAVSLADQWVAQRQVDLTKPIQVILGEWQRWRLFFGWPAGLPAAAVMLSAWAAARVRPTRVDRALALSILLFGLAMPMVSLNNTQRYLCGLVPLFAALVVRLVQRTAGGETAGRKFAAAGLAGGYALVGLGGISVMFYRLHDADLNRVLDRVAATVGPDARVYGELHLWMAGDRFHYGPFPIGTGFQEFSLDLVRAKHFDYAVRSGWRFNTSHGVSKPPRKTPPLRSRFCVDAVCEHFGTKIDAFWDPDFGPMEIYRLRW